MIMMEDFLLANRVLTDKKSSQSWTDAAGDFYLAPITETSKSINEIKDLCERFEQKHPLGRLIDVDVVDNKGIPISSGKTKKCFICDEPAMFCARKQNHSIEELNSYISGKIGTFLKTKKLEETKVYLSALATQCLLYEISLSPKPGLVDKFGSGAHKDMDYFSFLNSTASLSAYWSSLIDLAHRVLSDNKINETEELRLIGIAMERTMLQFTNGVNTQKGAIFLIGMLVYAAAKIIFKGSELTDANIQNELVSLNNKNLDDELLKAKSTSTHGKKMFEKYGNETGGGIRKELALGLPIVFNHALPILRQHACEKGGFLKSEQTAQPVLIKCLLKIISINNDSNILYRSNIETLKQLQTMADNCLKNDVDFNSYYKKLCDFCIDKYVSPGGSADLLAASLFIFQLQKTI
jgi:holo-ACP synthase/triphosphoribosyl-dephospho-CoA synthase